MRCQTSSSPCPVLTRRSFALLLLTVPSAARAAGAPCETPIRVLFVCPAGTVKSAIAREVLKARAAGAGVQVTVSSRGLSPEDHVSPTLAANLRADGVDLARETVRAMTLGDVAAADIVIAFDEAAKAPALKTARAWDIPSWNAEYAGAKAALSTQLDGLIVELRGRASNPCRAASR